MVISGICLLQIATAWSSLGWPVADFHSTIQLRDGDPGQVSSGCINSNPLSRKKDIFSCHPRRI